MITVFAALADGRLDVTLASLLGDEFVRMTLQSDDIREQIGLRLSGVSILPNRTVQLDPWIATCQNLDELPSKRIQKFEWGTL